MKMDISDTSIMMLAPPDLDLAVSELRGDPVEFEWAQVEHRPVRRRKVPPYHSSIVLAEVMLDELVAEWEGSDAIIRPYWHIVSLRDGMWSVQIRADDATRSWPLIMPVEDEVKATAISRVYLLYRMYVDGGAS